MEHNSRARKFLLGGAIIGGLMSVSITLLMDGMYSDSMQGTWRDAIAKDLNSLMSLGVSSKSVIVTLAFLVILAILAAFGAFMGFIFSFFLYKFFELLGKK
jgi:ABC-type multidrug transport system permease subunit